MSMRVMKYEEILVKMISIFAIDIHNCVHIVVIAVRHINRNLTLALPQGKKRVNLVQIFLE